MNLAAERIPSNLFDKEKKATKAQAKIIRRLSS